jgi:hypothetical protein
MEPETDISQAHEDGAPSNAILVVLAYLESIGMISSAADVYAGRCPLVIDNTKWETADDLASKLMRAEKGAKEHNIHALNRDDDDDDDEGGSYPEFLLSNLQNEDKKSCDKLPFFFSYNLGTKMLSSRRFNFHGRRPGKELLEEAGFTPSASLRAGITGTRKFYRQFSRSNNKGLEGSLGH